MPMTGLTPTLMVQDVNRAVHFYREVLGFAFVWGLAAASRTPVAEWPAPAPLAMALVQNGAASLSFQTRSFMVSTLPRLANENIGGSLVLFMECEDLDALCEGIGERAPFLKAPHTTSHGTRQCSIEDPDGYILTFVERPAQPAHTPETAA
jgi:catechol 2,3-dioxygenase-like lactoylglutathione lyase family enzyme